MDRKSVRVILDSPHWTSALLPNGSSGGTLTGGRLKSPLRDLVENMPEEAAHVLGKCITGSDHAATDSDDFEVTQTLSDRADTVVNLHLYLFLPTGADRLQISPGLV